MSSCSLWVIAACLTLSISSCKAQGCDNYCENWCDSRAIACHMLKCDPDNPSDCPGSTCSWQCKPSGSGENSNEVETLPGGKGIILAIVTLCACLICCVTAFIWKCSRRRERKHVQRSNQESGDWLDSIESGFGTKVVAPHAQARNVSPSPDLRFAATRVKASEQPPSSGSTTADCSDTQSFQSNLSTNSNKSRGSKYSKRSGASRQSRVSGKSAKTHHSNVSNFQSRQSQGTNVLEQKLEEDLQRISGTDASKHKRKVPLRDDGLLQPMMRRARVDLPEKRVTANQAEGQGQSRSPHERAQPVPVAFRPKEGDMAVRKNDVVQVVKVDRSLEPPSYVVKLKNGREVGCEASNLTPVPKALEAAGAPGQDSMDLDPAGRRRLTEVLKGFSDDPSASA